jgi:hypothetical protein
MSRPPVLAAGGLLCLAALLTFAHSAAGQAAPSIVRPVLDFPEAGLDDPAAYAGYRTRFFRDIAGNTVQVYISGDDGRLVALWADAANESAAFTVRDPAGRPVPLEWAGDRARIGGDEPGTRWIELELAAPGTAGLRIGLFTLGTMRFERDVQYQALHRGPLDAPLRMPELVGLVDRLERLPPGERAGHLAALDAADLGALRSRLEPALEMSRSGGRWRLRASQPSFDGRGRLTLDVSGDDRVADARLDGRTLAVRPRAGEGPVRLTIRVVTDAAPLTPLAREEIFSRAFLEFIEDAARTTDPGDPHRHRRLERQVRSAELLSSREKLMAGLPNFATYFGRDMLMTALMMEAIWAPAMTEHVIASALRKLAPDGDVSHEEALGGQAIREAAAEYSRLADGALDPAIPDRERHRLLAEARAVLGAIAATRENHRMVDDDFQLPVVVAGWLADRRVPPARQRAFLLDPARPDGPTRLELLVRNLGLVADRTAAYAADPRTGNLVGFPPSAEGRWHSASWRDSGPGYGNGRYALDVNAIWAPHALAAAGAIFASVEALGLEAELARAVARAGVPALALYARDPATVEDAVVVWRGAAAHFLVELDAAAARATVEGKLASLPAVEADHWRGVMAAAGTAANRGLRFLALALDSAGRPIPVASTDPAMGLFLGEPTASLAGLSATEVLEPILAPYPVGLFIAGVGPVVSNDAYAAPAVQAAFEADSYHSPRTIWGREANLLLLGLAGLVAGAGAEDGPALRAALDRTLAAVEGSGLKHHELWSYRIDAAGLEPVRYGTSSDVQLWNVTDLAVQYALSRLPRP